MASAKGKYSYAPLNARRSFGRRKKAIADNAAGFNTATGEPLDKSKKAYRAGYSDGVKDMYDDIKGSLGYKSDERLPAGKGIDVGLFDVKTKK